jgi:hypothetical protein
MAPADPAVVEWLRERFTDFDDLCHYEEKTYWVDSDFESDLYEAWEKGRVGRGFQNFEDFEEKYGGEYVVDTNTNTSLDHGIHTATFRLVNGWVDTPTEPLQQYLDKLNPPDALRKTLTKEIGIAIRYRRYQFATRQQPMKTLLDHFLRTADKEWTLRRSPMDRKWINDLCAREEKFAGITAVSVPLNPGQRTSKNKDIKLSKSINQD